MKVYCVLIISLFLLLPRIFFLVQFSGKLKENVAPHFHLSLLFKDNNKLTNLVSFDFNFGGKYGLRVQSTIFLRVHSCRGQSVSSTIIRPTSPIIPSPDLVNMFFLRSSTSNVSHVMTHLLLLKCSLKSIYNILCI
jgi:hypothetical protein